MSFSPGICHPAVRHCFTGQRGLVRNDKSSGGVNHGGGEAGNESPEFRLADASANCPARHGQKIPLSLPKPAILSEKFIFFLPVPQTPFRW